MNAEKAAANDHALTELAHREFPMFTTAIDTINMLWKDPDNQTAVNSFAFQARIVRDLMYHVVNISAALADLKSKLEFCVAHTIEHPSGNVKENFKIQPGAKSIKCDAQADSMRQLMERFKGAGFDPCALFEKCSAITAKKAAEAFGLSEQALLESAGDLFATHQNKPTVKML